MVRPARQHTATAGFRRLEPAQVGVERRLVGQGADMVWIEGQGAGQNLARLVVAQGMQQKAAQRRQIIGALRLERGDAAEGDHGLFVPPDLEHRARRLSPGVGLVGAAADPGAGGVFQPGPVAAAEGIVAGQGAAAVLQRLELGCQVGLEARGLGQRALGVVPASLGGQGLALPREGVGVVRQLAGPPGWVAWTSDAASGAA
jgi:hypothetical protein